MLEFMRRGAASWVAKILFVLLIISFGAWGIGDFLKPDLNRAVATVGRDKITPREFQESYRQEYDRLSQRFGGRLTREFANQLGLPQQVLRQIITRRLVDIEAKRLGITISDDQVRQQIYANPAFRGLGGNFDQGRFQQLLQANGLTEANYVASIRQELGMQQLAGAIIVSPGAPQSLADALYTFREEQRTASLMPVPNASIGIVAEPTDDELKAFHDAHKERFMAPEYRALTLLVLKPEDVMGDITPTDAEIKAAYDARIGEFRTPGTRDVQQLLFTDEAAAKEAQAALASGQTLDTVAEAAKAKGGERSNLGVVKQGELFPKQVEDAAFALTAPGVAPPVQSPLGWHVLVVDKITPQTERPLAEVKEQLAKDVARDAAVEKLRGLANKIEDDIAGGATLEEAAKELGVAPIAIAATDRNGTSPDGTSVEGLLGRPFVIATAFDAAEGVESPLADTPDNGMFSVRVDKITPSALKPLDQIRADVAQAWRAERIQQRAKDLAEAYADRARKGEPLAKIAEDAKLTVKVTQPFKRDANIPADMLPAPVATALFGVEKGGAVVVVLPQGPVVGVVETVVPADPATAKDAVQQVRERLAGALSADVEVQFNKALEDRIGVKIDEAQLQRAVGS